MRIKFSITGSKLMAAGLVLLGTGCSTIEKCSLTYRLWDNGEMRKWSEPAPNPNLALFQASIHGGVLVRYDAFSEKHSRVERHAYYLELNQGRIVARKKPNLASPSVADGMQPIPVLTGPGAVTNMAPGSPVYAITTKEGREFTIYRAGESRETFGLPVYAETSGAATRIVLTPFAVAGDTVMVAAVAAVIGFIIWAESGAPTR